MNWQTKKLGEVAYCQDGDWILSQNMQKDGDIRLIQLGDIGDGEFLNKTNKYITSSKCNELKCSLLQTGDILLARLGDPLGKSCILPDLHYKSITAVDCTIIRGNEKVVLQRYLLYIINSGLFRSQLRKFTTGTTRRRISRKNLEKITVALPPITFQRAIVEKLDAIRESQELNQKEIEKTEELFDSFIRELILKNINKWQVKSIRELTIKVGSGSTPRGGKKVYQSKGIYFIRSQNVMMDRLDFSDIVYIDDDTNKKMGGTQVLPNDVLLNITGASIGRVAVFPKEYEIANVNQHVCIIRLITSVIPQYVCLYLSSSEGQNQISNMQSGATRQGLNFEQVKKLKIPIPTYSEQQKIVEKFEIIKKFKEKLIQERGKLLELFESTLSKLMRGELVS